MKKLLMGLIVIAVIMPLASAVRFVYYHTFADEKARLRYELSDFHYGMFFITHSKILNKKNGCPDSSDKFELKINKKRMKEEGIPPTKSA